MMPYRAYRVSLAADRPTDLPKVVGTFGTIRAARAAAKGAVAGPRGASEVGPPACCLDAIEAYCDRDERSDHDGPLAYIESLGLEG